MRATSDNVAQKKTGTSLGAPISDKFESGEAKIPYFRCLTPKVLVI